MKLKNIETITLDWKEFSAEAFEQFKDALETFDLYIGDIFEDYYDLPDGNTTDTYCMYIAKRKLKRKEIKKMFPEFRFDENDLTSIILKNKGGKK